MEHLLVGLISGGVILVCDLVAPKEGMWHDLIYFFGGGIAVLWSLHLRGFI